MREDADRVARIFRPGENWPQWSTPQSEIEVLRRAMHMAAQHIATGAVLPDYMRRDEQSIVDHFVARARNEPVT